MPPQKDEEQKLDFVGQLASHAQAQNNEEILSFSSEVEDKDPHQNCALTSILTHGICLPAPSHVDMHKDKNKNHIYYERKGQHWSWLLNFSDSNWYCKDHVFHEV